MNVVLFVLFATLYICTLAETIHHWMYHKWISLVACLVICTLCGSAAIYLAQSAFR